MVDRIWQSGMESGDIDEIDSVVNSSASSADKYTGTYSMLCAATNNTCYGIKSVPATRQIRLGYHIKATSWSTLDADTQCLTVRSVSATLAYLDYNYVNGTLRLYVNGAIRDTYLPYSILAWRHIALDVNIDSSSGWVKVYLDGSEVLSYTGNTGNADIRFVWFGKTSGISGGFHAVYIDNMYIDDTTGESSPTAPPIKKFYPINVNGDGNYSQWTPVPTGSHYQNVDERPPNDDTDYLEAVTGSLLDSFTMTTFTLDTNENIIAMIPYVFAKRGSTTEQISLGTRSSGTDLVGNAQDLSTNYDYIWDRQVTGSLGFDWNQSYLDSVEVIINSTGTY